MRVKLSVVIPTKNRTEYCVKTVESLLKLSVDLNICICDSSDDDGLGGVIEKIGDSRIKYRRTPSLYNMTQNFNAALSMADGDYVSMIGDDDALAPEIKEAIEWCEAHDIDSLSSARFYYEYNWPDYTSKKTGKALSGKLISSMGEKDVTMSNTAQAVGDFLKRAGQGSGSLPRIYHGLISQRLLKRMKAQYGDWFFGVSPDVSFSYLAGKNLEYNAIAH